MGSKDNAIKKAMGKNKVDEETHGQYLAQKEKEAQSSGKSSFQAFKQTHPVDGKPGVEEEVEEETEEEPLEEGFDDLQKYMADKKNSETGKFDKKKTNTGTTYTRKPETYSDDNAEKSKTASDASDGPKKKGRPKKDKFAESADSTGHMLVEGALDKIAHQYSKEVKDFMANGDLDDDLFSALYDYYFDDMPYGTKKARDGDPYEWVAGRFHQDMNMRGLRETEAAAPAAPAMAPAAPMAESGAFVPGRIVYWRGKAGRVDRVEGNKCFVNKANGEMDVWPTREVSTEKQGMLDTLGGDIKGIGQGIKNFVMNKPDPMDEEKDQKDDFFHNPDIPADRQLPAPPKQVDVELNELAKLAGLSEAKKCNSTMEGKSCPVHGLKECGSMTEAKKPDFLDMDKDGDKKEPMKKALKDKEKVDECGPGPMGSMNQDDGNMSINTSMNSDGTKSVSVNATGDQADVLAQILKMAGLAAHQSVHGGEQEPKAIVIQAGPEEQVEEERDIEYANTPDEEVENVDAILHQGDDLNREKEQYAGMAKAGDNPMATRESIEMPARISRMLAGVKQAKW